MRAPNALLILAHSTHSVRTAPKHLDKVTWVVHEELARPLSLSNATVHDLSSASHSLSLTLSLENNKEQMLFHVPAVTHLSNTFELSPY